MRLANSHLASATAGAVGTSVIRSQIALEELNNFSSTLTRVQSRDYDSRQCECNDVATRGHRGVLLAANGVAHGRGMNELTNVKVPDGLSRTPVQYDEVVGVVTVGNKARRGGYDATPSFVGADLFVTPGKVEFVQVKSVDVGGAGLVGEAGASSVVAGSRLECFRSPSEDRAAVVGPEIERVGGGIVAGGVPICGAPVRRTHFNSVLIGHRPCADRPAILIDPFGPIQLLRELFCEKEMAVRSVQDIEEAVAIGGHNEFARPPPESCIDKDGRLRGVVVVQIVRAELEVPFELSRIWIQRQQGTGIKVVAGAHAGVVIGRGIAGAPVEDIEIGIVGTRDPRGPAAVQVEVPGPAFIAFFAGAGDRPKTPLLLPGLRIVCRYEAAYAIVASGNADDHLVFDHQGRARGPVVAIPGCISHFPDEISGAGIEAEQMRVVCFHVDARAQYCHTAVVMLGGIVNKTFGNGARMSPKRVPGHGIQGVSIIALVTNMTPATTTGVTSSGLTVCG